MANALILDILTPTGPVAVAHGVSTSEVRVPGSQGELGILADHVPFMTTIVPGVIRFSAAGKEVRLAVRNGFLEVGSDGRLTILSDRVALPDDIKPEALRSRLAEVVAQVEASAKIGPTDRPEHQTLVNERAWLEAQLLVANASK